VPVIHVWFVVEPGARGMTLNAPLFEGVVDGNALVAAPGGRSPCPASSPSPATTSSQDAHERLGGTSLETILKAEGRDILIETGAWTNMSIEHTARTGADKGYVMVIPEDGCSTMNADWHRLDQLRHAERRRRDQGISRRPRKPRTGRPRSSGDRG
jgi:gluconolactonase